MPLKKYASFLLILFWPINLFSQFEITAWVKDEENESLAFVTVNWNADPMLNTFTDIDGKFVIKSNIPISEIQLRYVGKQALSIKSGEFPSFIKDGKMIFYLTGKDEWIDEIVVVPGENPADVLIREVVKSKAQNDPMALPSFTCYTYNKVFANILVGDSIFLSDPSKKRREIKNKRNLDLKRQSEKHGLFMIETVSKKYFKYPTYLYDEVLLNKVSGFQQTAMLAIATAVQPFSFYNEIITILDKEYINPISARSERYYFFNIIDSIFQNGDTIVQVSFKPHTKLLNGFEGQMYIQLRHHAIQSVQAMPYETNMSSIQIEQQYYLDTVYQKWFPKELNFELIFKDYPLKHQRVILQGRSFIDQVKIGVPVEYTALHEKLPVNILKTPKQQQDSLWNIWHVKIPLSAKEQYTHYWVDSMFNLPINRILTKAIAAFSISKWVIYKQHGFDLSDIIQFSEYENIRLSMGLTNSTRRQSITPHRFEYLLQTGYGIADKEWKYRISATYTLSNTYGISLTATHTRDFEEPGGDWEISTSLRRDRKSLAKIIDKATVWQAELNTRVGKNINMSAGILYKKLDPAYPYTYLDTIQHFQFFHWTVQGKMMLSSRKQVFQSLSRNYTKWPVLQWKFVSSIPHSSLSNTSYQGLTINVSQQMMVKRLGLFEYDVQLGRIWGHTPLQNLFSINQSSGNWFSFIIKDKTFQTIPSNTLWIASRLLKIYLFQDFGHFLYRKKWSSPTFAVSQHMAVGKLDHRNEHTFSFISVPNKPYFETGLHVNHILKFSFRKAFNVGFGVAFFAHWREEPAWNKMFESSSVRLSMQFEL